MSQFEPHPIADLFPMLSDDELQELADDIAANGLNNPVVLLDRKIIDGRNKVPSLRDRPGRAVVHRL